jgi:hypothetical protein
MGPTPFSAIRPTLSLSLSHLLSVMANVFKFMPLVHLFRRFHLHFGANLKFKIPLRLPLCFCLQMSLSLLSLSLSYFVCVPVVTKGGLARLLFKRPTCVCVCAARASPALFALFARAN